MPRLTLCKCVVSTFIQRSWQIRNWTIGPKFQLYKMKWRLRCYRGRTCFIHGFIVWMLGVLAAIKPNGKQRQDGHVHVLTPLEHPHPSKTWLDQNTARAPLRSLFNSGEYQGGNEQQGYDPRATPVVWTVGVAVWCESIAYHIQKVICYGNVHSSLNKKVQPVDELKWCSISCLLRFNFHIYEIMNGAARESAFTNADPTREDIPMSSSSSSLIIPQGPVVQRLDNAIHRINRYPADKC